MNKQEKAERIRAQLAELYPEPPIPLSHVDPFSLLVAVMLSAQTTDARVNLVTPALFARAPTPDAMAALDTSEILGLIRTCGLAPTKARNLSALARLLVERHGGVVPADMESLEALPGVGHKTASVVLSQAFGIATFPVDTHIHRLATRWGLSDGSNVARTEADLKALFAAAEWRALHLQIIYFGREHCPALRHLPETCPICSWASSPPRAARRKVAGTPRSKKAGPVKARRAKQPGTATARSGKRKSSALAAPPKKTSTPRDRSARREQPRRRKALAS